MSTIIEIQPAASSGLKKLLVRRPLLSFFVMATLFSWITLIPYILSQWNIFPNTKAFAVFFALNSFAGPMLASYIMHRTLGGKKAWQNVRKSLKPHLSPAFLTRTDLPFAVGFCGVALLILVFTQGRLGYKNNMESIQKVTI